MTAGICQNIGEYAPSHSDAVGASRTAFTLISQCGGAEGKGVLICANACDSDTPCVREASCPSHSRRLEDVLPGISSLREAPWTNSFRRYELPRLLIPGGFLNSCIRFCFWMP